MAADYISETSVPARLEIEEGTYDMTAGVVATNREVSVHVSYTFAEDGATCPLGDVEPALDLRMTLSAAKALIQQLQEAVEASEKAETDEKPFEAPVAGPRPGCGKFHSPYVNMEQVN